MMNPSDLWWEARKADTAARADANDRRVRRRGTVRFSPYVKVQWWDETSLAWRDVQAQYADEVDALLRCPLDSFPRGADWRLMYVSPEGRTPGERRPARDPIPPPT